MSGAYTIPPGVDGNSPNSTTTFVVDMGKRAANIWLRSRLVDGDAFEPSA